MFVFKDLFFIRPKVNSKLLCVCKNLPPQPREISNFFSLITFFLFDTDYHRVIKEHAHISSFISDFVREKKAKKMREMAELCHKCITDHMENVYFGRRQKFTNGRRPFVRRKEKRLYVLKDTR